MDSPSGTVFSLPNDTVYDEGDMIRPARPEDYPAISAIHNTCWPAHPTTADNVARLDQSLERERFVLELDGEVVAQACLEGRSETRFLDLDVRPEHQSRGFGARMLAWLEPKLMGKTTCFVREDHPFAFDFAARRGFREVLRSWHQSLEVARFDPVPFRELFTRLEREGYEIACFGTLDDPDRERKLHALYAQTSQDVPGATDIPDFERFRARTLEGPLFLPDAYFIAIRNGEWVGYTGTRQRTQDAPLEWHTGMTGMLRQHRGKGLATALKVRVIELAQARGIRELHTNNASTNTGILSVNARLGYTRDAGQIQLERNRS